MEVTDQTKLHAVIQDVLVSYVGECICDVAYTGRGMEDPNCIWHAAGGYQLVEDVADAVDKYTKE